jgi:hypothetical protein
MSGRYWRFIDLLEIGENEAAWRNLEEYTRLAETLRHPHFRAMATVASAMFAMIEGRLDEGERLVFEAFELGKQANSRNAEQWFGIAMYTMARMRGTEEAVVESVRAVVDRLPDFLAWRTALASLHAVLGQEEKARAELDRIVARGIERVPRYANPLVSYALLAETCALLEERDLARAVHDMMLPYASRSVIAANGAGHLGVMSHYLGMTAAVAGRPAEADDWYAHALACYERMNAKPFVARALADRAVVSVAGHAARATMLERACTIAREIGMVRTLQRAEALLAMVRARRAVQYVARPTGDAASRECRFHNEGQYWTIVFRGAVVRLRDVKGMRCLAELLRAPGRDLHVVELDAARAAPAVRTRARGGLNIDGARADPLLDRRAKAEYRARLADLKAQIDDAEDAGDLGRAAKSRAELELVEQALMAATGLLGRDRASGVRAERARLNVTRAVRSAMRAIARAHPVLGRHLAASITTGRFCRYGPSADDDVSWIF